MFLKRLSAALVTITCLGWAALGAAPETLTTATTNGNENSALAPLAIVPILTPTSPRCNGENNGSIRVEILLGTGTAPYSCRIRKGGLDVITLNNQNSPFTTPPSTNLSAGTYSVFITDAVGQTSGERTVTITDNPVLNLDLSAPINYPDCSNETSTTIQFQATGGNSTGYIYTLLPANLSQPTGTFTVGTGIFNIFVTDASQCSKSYAQTIQINKIDPLAISFQEIEKINCDNGFASVKIIGVPSEPNKVSFLNTTLNKTYASHTIDNVYTNLEAGVYSVTVSRNSCPTIDTRTINFTIDKFDIVKITPTPSSPIILNCGGINDLTTITLDVTGGNSTRQVRVMLDNNDGLSNDQEATVSYGSKVIFNNVTVGNYTIRWNDVLNPSCSGTQSYVISNPASPLVWVNDPIGQKPLCSGDANGLITMNVSGGATGAKKYFVDGALIPLPINKPAGTYEVWVEDSKGCATEKKQVTIDPQTPLSLTHNPAEDVNVTCPRGSNGEIHMTVTGGIGGYKYKLFNKSGVLLRNNVSTPENIVISALWGDTYRVQVFDANGCEAGNITGIEILEPGEITIADEDFILDTIKCNAETATLMVKATGGGDPNMTYKLYRGTTLVNTIVSSGVVTFSNLIPSSYNLSVWSGLICKKSLAKRFTVVDRKKLEVINVIDSLVIKCPGDAPTFTLTVDGEAPFSYSIDGTTIQNVILIGNSVVISSGLTTSPTGSLNRIIVKDFYGCEKDVLVKVFEPSPIVTSDLFPKDALCNSKSSGSVSLKVEGGTPGYTLSLIDAVTSAIVKTYPHPTGVNVIIPAVAAGTYNLGITDRNGCVATNLPTGIVVNEPDLLVIDSPVYDQIKCFGTTTKATITASGGWPVNKTIKIVGEGVNMSVPSGRINTLGAGTYTLTASNTDGCTANRILSITQPPKLVLDSVKADNVSCNGANDAKISFKVKGGVSGYQYGLQGLGSADVAFTGTSHTITTSLIAADYKLIIKDANSCESNIVPVKITEPAKVIFNVRFDSVSCNGASDGKIIIENATGGNNSFISYLTRPGGTEQRSIFPVISNLPYGAYSVRITDTKNCTSEVKPVTIGQPELIVITKATISDSLSCYNDQDAAITIEAIGGLPYNLQYKITGRGYQTNKTFTNLPSGEYEVWVKNSNGECEIKYPNKLIVINPDPITITSVDKTNVSCYNLQDGEVKINGQGGTGTLNYLLVGAPASIPNNPNSTGRFTQLGDLNSTSATYNYRVVDQKGCRKTGSFPILNPPELKISELDYHDVLCSGQANGWIEVEVTGGTKEYSFQRNTGSAVTTDVEKLTETSYKILKFGGGTFTPVVIDANGCTETLAPSVTIVDPKPLQIVDPIDWGVKKCNGDMDDVTTISVTGGTPGYYYSLDNGESYGELNDSIFVGVPAGVKYPRVKDKYGCLSPEHESYIMKEPLLFEVDYKFFPILCYDDKYGDMKLKITGGNGPYTFSLSDPPFTSPGTNVFPNASTDTTTVLISDEGLNLEPGTTYHFYMKDANGCHLQNFPKVRDVSHSFADTSFIRPTELFLDSLAPHRVWCGDSATGRIEFFASGGTAPLKYTDYSLKVIPDERPDLSYKNVPGINSVERLRAGLYYCILTDKNGCYAQPKTDKSFYTDTTTIDASNKAIVLTVSGLDTITCNNSLDGAIEITVKNFLEDGISWKAQIWQNDTIRSTRPYTTTDDGYIEADPRSSEGYQGHFLYSAYAKKIMEDIGIGRYIITVTDNQTRCMASVDTMLYSLNGDSCPPLNFYNTFTHYSGGNKYNDWKLGGSKNLVYNLKVYTSWGDLVYDSYDKNGVQKVTAADKNGIKWDGLDNKQRPVPAGTYIYLLRTGIAPNDTLMNGNITILRNNGR